MPFKRATSEKVSPTAYATGYFWVRHGLSHPALATAKGKQLDKAFSTFIRGIRFISGISLESLMLARHRGIDGQLRQAIESGRVTQVIEIAAGLSGRGLRMTQRYPQLRYIETDLPHMASLKRQLLSQAGLLSDRLEVRNINALTDQGPESLAAIAEGLDPGQGTAIITEGLMNYLDPKSADGVWQRIATTLKRFPSGIYLCDSYLLQENRNPAMLIFGAMLTVFVRGRLHYHYRDEASARRKMRESGFGKSVLIRADSLPENRELSGKSGADRIRVLVAEI